MQTTASMAYRFSIAFLVMAISVSLRGQDTPPEGGQRQAEAQDPELQELHGPEFVPAPEGTGFHRPTTCASHPVSSCLSYDSRGWWGQAEYLRWWTQGMDVPALATAGDMADELPAAIGQPNTQILFGNTALNHDARSGGRFTLGKWLDASHCSGLEATYLTLAREEAAFSASSDDVPVLGRPFFNTATEAQDARLIGDPGTVSGTLDVAATTEFDSLELLYRRACRESYGTRLDLLLGYRFAELDDHVRIGESTLSLSGPTTGTTIDLVDQFDTRNRFHGAELGLVLHGRETSRWSWEAVAKVALGESRQQAGVSGQTTTRDDIGNENVIQGGLLAQGTNIGTYRRDDFATVTEAGITVRRKLRHGWTARFGYTVIYWSDVARAGDQIDTTVNPTQIPPGELDGEARPAFPLRTTDFWAQGLRFGLDYKF